MVAKVHFFPLGNADTLRIDLANGDKVLVDYANMRCADDKTTCAAICRRSCGAISRRPRRNNYNAVCITHLDDDHCKGFGEFFWLRHAKVYQDDDRIQYRRALGAGLRASRGLASTVTPASSAPEARPPPARRQGHPWSSRVPSGSRSGWRRTASTTKAAST